MNLFLVALYFITNACQQVSGDYSYLQFGTDEEVPTLSTRFRREILIRCNIAFDASSPQENEGIPTTVQAVFMIDRFLDINEVLGTMKLVAGFTTIWQVPCVAAVARQLGFSNFTGLMMLNETQFWKPPIFNRNAPRDIAMTDFTKVLQLQPDIGAFRLMTVGSFETICELELGEFPFDKQECLIEMEPFLSTNQLLINNHSLINETFSSGEAFPVGSSWRLDGLGTRIETIRFQQRNYQQVNFVVRLHRSPRYYILSVIVVNTIFTVLIFLAVLLPPDSSKRSLYSITINLAYFLQLTQVLEMTPHTSQPIFLTTYLISEIVYAMVLTIYSVLMACFIDSFPEEADRIVKLGKILGKDRELSLVRFVDVVFFYVFWLAMAALQIKPSIIFISYGANNL